MRARASSAVGTRPSALLAGLGVGDGVRDGAGGAGARREASAVVERRCPRRRARGRGACRRAARRGGGSGRRRRGSGSGRTRSRRRGSARPRPGTCRSPRTGTVQCASGEVVVDERPQRLVAVEADAVEIVRLALVPVRRRREIDDRRRRALLGLRPPRAAIAPSGATSSVRTTTRPGGVEAGEAPAVGERLVDGLPVAGASWSSRDPSSERFDDRRAPGSQNAAAASASEDHRGAAAERQRRPRRPGAGQRSRRRALPAVLRPARAQGRGSRARAGRRRPPPPTAGRPGSRRRRSGPR